MDNGESRDLFDFWIIKFNNKILNNAQSLRLIKKSFETIQQ